jgi:hypothetical protein
MCARKYREAHIYRWNAHPLMSPCRAGGTLCLSCVQSRSNEWNVRSHVDPTEGHMSRPGSVHLRVSNRSNLSTFSTGSPESTHGSTPTGKLPVGARVGCPVRHPDRLVGFTQCGMRHVYRMPTAAALQSHAFTGT